MRININIEDMKKSFDNMYCGNCGKLGHIYRRCTEPITSLGIILFRHNKKDQLEYLMIRRRNTLGFVEFMRGKYNLENYKYIYELFSIMTKTERECIVVENFDSLWNTLWMNKQVKQYYSEYESSKKKFNKLKEGYKIDDTLIISLIDVNSKVPYCYNTPEWGFPKGRRNVKEIDIDCSRREFSEETGLIESDYTIDSSIDPVEEVFLGTNNIRYKHRYFIGKLLNTTKEVGVDKNNFNMISEISDIKWITFELALKKIRPYNLEKKEMLTKLNEKLVTL